MEIAWRSHGDRMEIARTCVVMSIVADAPSRAISSPPSAPESYGWGDVLTCGTRGTKGSKEGMPRATKGSR